MMNNATSPSARPPRVIVVGGGFAGLAAARALAKAPVEVLVVDRRNHHVFQPLLYQVATASLSPAEISAPIRAILCRQQNCSVLLAEATGVDVDKRLLHFGRGSLQYDYLILAAGATHSYFGHDDWAPLAPGLKSLEDATELRKRILLAFESAEYEGSNTARQAALTFAVVGGGPTGVELAGAIKEIAGQTIPRDYKHIDTRTTRVLLFQSGNRLIPGFSDKLGEKVLKYLQTMGVGVRLNSHVTEINADGVKIKDEFIPVRNVFWAAGVRANPIGESLGARRDKSGRVEVKPDLTIEGHPEVFVTGDMAAATSADTGKPVPGVAQGGLQMGRYAGTIIARETTGRAKANARQPFKYHDKGSMAVIGKARAVAQLGKIQIGGLLGWLLWGAIHIMFLVGFRNRVMVMMSWFWNWLINARDARLITGDSHLRVDVPRPGDFNPNPEPGVEGHAQPVPSEHR